MPVWIQWLLAAAKVANHSLTLRCSLQTNPVASEGAWNGVGVEGVCLHSLGLSTCAGLGLLEEASPHLFCSCLFPDLQHCNPIAFLLYTAGSESRISPRS